MSGGVGVATEAGSCSACIAAVGGEMLTILSKTHVDSPVSSVHGLRRVSLPDDLLSALRQRSAQIRPGDQAVERFREDGH